MPSSRLLALAVEWWIKYRDVDPVRRALRLTDVEHWHPLIKNALESNKELHRTPSTWAALANRLDRDPTSIFKTLTSGTSEASMNDLRSVALILGLPLTTLLMSDRDRNAKAARTLCKGGATLVETTAYVVYREMDPAVEDGQLDPQFLREVIRIVQQISTVQNANLSILKVARCLEPSLKVAQNKSLKKRERDHFESNGKGTIKAALNLLDE